MELKEIREKVVELREWAMAKYHVPDAFDEIIFALDDRIKELEAECIVIAKSHDEIQDRAENSKSRVLNICSQILSFIDAVDEHGIKSWTAKDEIEAKIKELLKENEV